MTPTPQPRPRPTQSAAYRTLLRRHTQLMLQQQYEGALLPRQELERREIAAELERVEMAHSGRGQG